MKYAVTFVLLMFAVLTFESLTAGGRPEDDPVHGTYRAPPITASITKNRDRWVAELERGRDLPYDQTPQWIAFETMAGEDMTPDQIAWVRVYYQWRDGP